MALCSTVDAQTNPNLETGLKPYGSFEGGNIDSISLTNGNLTLRIPLFSYPQRGSIPGNINLSYNNKNWYVFQWCQNGICHDQWRWNLRSLNGIYFTDDGGAGVAYAPLPPLNLTYLFTAYTSDGGSHEMVPDNAGGYHTVDGTGIYYNGAVAGDGRTPLVRTRDGSQPLTVDPNGNLATSGNPGPNGPSAGVVTDTLGRYLPGSGNSTTDYSGCIQPAAPNQINSASISTLPGTNRMMKTCSATYSLQTNFQQYDANSGNGTPILEGTYSAAFIVSVVLYNGSSWSTSPAWGFDYVSRDAGDPSTINYGDLTKITLPTGGTISYQWYTAPLCTASSALTQVSRTVGSKTVDAQDGSGPQLWDYAVNAGLPSGSGSASGTIVTGPAPGNDQTVHAMATYGTCGYYEIQTNFFQGSATTGTLLKTIKTDYIHTANPYVGLNAPDVNVFPIRTTTIWPNGKTTKIEKDYDSNFHGSAGTFSYGQVTAVREYDYGTVANTPGPLLRTTSNVYLSASNSSYLAVNLLDLVSSTTVKDGNGIQVAQTTYTYDDQPLQTSGITTQHDNTKALSPRGNRTTTCRWLNTTGASICTTTKYFDTGMPYAVTDPAGNTTTFTYSSTYAGAYVTQTNLPDTGSPAVHHVIGGSYDFNTGQLMSFTDQNNQQSTYSYDPLGRLTSASFPDLGQTTFTFNDAALAAYVERQEKVVGSTMNVFRVLFDGLARKKQTQLRSDPSGIVYTDFTYDQLGRLYTQSNPYRSTSDPTYGVTTHNYDSLNRETLTIPPGGSQSNSVQTQYCAASTMVIDQSGHWRRSTGDGLGRLIEADEPNSTSATVNVCPGTGEPIWVTAYSYDTLNNLKTVLQNSSRNRSFAFDSLSRMTSSTNPEAGTVTYSYDVDGNVFSKQDARGVVATYGYDALNRLTGKAFTDGTAPVGYYFDGKLPVTGSASPGTGSVTISGSERSFLNDCGNPPCQTIYDTGTVSVTVGSVTKTVNYQHGSTSSTVATALRSAINTDSNSPATAGGTGATITLNSKASGAITNYSLSASAATTDENDFPPPPAASFTATPSGPSLTGGSTGCNASGINLTPAYAIGRRTGMCDAGGSEAWSFDTIGREVTEQRTTNGQTKSTSYTYNPDGSMATLTYPSGRTITYTPNAASQPVSAVDGTNGINYVTAAAYAPQGALSSLTLGYTGSFGGIQINDTYSPRLQPNELKAWSTAGVAMDLVYGFVDSNGKNNGNVVQVTNNKDNTRSQQFSYDQLNRILTAKTTATSGSNCWSYTFGIDVWANLNSAQPITGYSCTQANLSLSISTNNRITNTGFSYDASGNMLGDGLNTYSWDAESQIKTAAGVNYTYDGDGNRLQKSNGKIYWYGAGSEVLDESDASGNITDEYVFFGGKRVAHRVVSNGAIYYYAQDLLGSSRVITTATGSVCYEADFLPFGGEHAITNTCPQNYKFTGKERDSETGNDDFGARYYSSSLGRWLSPDWSSVPVPVPYANLSNPQTLNLYSMVADDPETFADLDGHCCDGITWNDVWHAGAAIASAIGTGAELIVGSGAAAVMALGSPVVAGVAIGYNIPVEPQGNLILDALNPPNDFRGAVQNENTGEQGRDAQGKFLPKQPGESKPGSADEKEGLASEGATKNTQPVPGSNRIPDGKKPDGQYVEVKSGEYVGNTRQLKDTGKAVVDATGKPLVVVTTNPNVKVSKPAQQNPNLTIKPLEK
ncbi:MAG TPA: RHS repeat-associated core domain-containing protein [Candidatus Acidoferrum sp.]|nr:RHS repeat-associated core domain-containing protein [Candidatus Acidoferrum sp.]